MLHQWRGLATGRVIICTAVEPEILVIEALAECWDDVRVDEGPAACKAGVWGIRFGAYPYETAAWDKDP